MAQQHNLTYTCPKCATDFSKPCVFARDDKEYSQVRSQLAIPFAEDPVRKICFYQTKCPNSSCDEIRQFPVLIEGCIS